MLIEGVRRAPRGGRGGHRDGSAHYHFRLNNVETMSAGEKTDGVAERLAS